MQSPPHKGKTAIILTGGGMRSAHGAGFLYALGTILRTPAPDIIIGSSGNAGNALYFAAREYECLKRTWTEILSTSRFISLLRPWRVIDIDYLIDVIFKTMVPLDIEALRVSTTKYFIPILDLRGSLRYVSDVDGIDPYELLRAAKAVPYVFGKKIMLQHTRYIDGGTGATLEDHIRCAQEHGADRMVIVMNNRSDTVIGSVAMKLYAYAASAGLRKTLLRGLRSRVVCTSSEDGTRICVKPEYIPTGLITRSQTKLQRSFDMGVADACRLESELRALLTYA